MTAWIIGLIAALGIGGGVAISNHGGGGGGHDSGYVEPAKPSVVSLLASADNPETIETKGADVSLTDGAFKVQAQRPVWDENGNLGHEPYEVSIGMEDFTNRDSYADYYEKESVTEEVSGAPKIQNRMMQKTVARATAAPQANDDSNPVTKKTTTDRLALGGQVLGLKNSDFGYHNSETEGVADYSPFYMYDTSKLAKEERGDTAVYKGHVLGVARSRELLAGMTGDINLNINFAAKTLNGDVSTKVSGKNWYDFNVFGDLQSAHSFSIDSVGVNADKTPDASLSAYDMNISDVSGSGAGLLLNGKIIKELIGEMHVSDNIVSADMTFGALATDKPQEENPAAKLNPNYDLISVLADNKQYKNIVYVKESGPDDVRLVNDDQTPPHVRGLKLGNDGESFLIDTGVLVEEQGKFLIASNGKYKEELQQWRVTADDQKEETDRYRLYKKETRSTISLHDSPVWHLHKLYLGGAKVGLTTADFGIWIEYRDGDGLSWRDRYREVYLYDKFYLYTGSRVDTVNFAGSALMVSPEQEEHAVPFEIESGSFNMTLNLANATLTGKMVMSNSKYDVDFSGTLSDHNKLKFTGEDVHEYSHGYLLQGKDGLETMGNIATYIDPTHADHHTNVYTFGAKEVK